MFHVSQGLNSHCFPIVGDGHQPNRRGLYTIPNTRSLDPSTCDKDGMFFFSETRMAS